MKRQYRVVIVDDERLARKELKTLLSGHPQIQVVAEADNVQKAVEIIQDLKPDVVFLDVQLSEETGFDLLDKVEVEFKFKVIFITAYDEYAVRAFEVNALDYLLKPINPERLANAIKRLSEAHDGFYEKYDKEIDEKSVRKLEYNDRIFLKLDNWPRFLKISTIKCICAAGDYSEIFTSDDKKALVLMSLMEWEDRLPERYFTRIHRSTIINLEYVDKVEKWFNYSYRLYLRNIKEPFVISRRYSIKLRRKLK